MRSPRGRDTFPRGSAAKSAKWGTGEEQAQKPPEHASMPHGCPPWPSAPTHPPTQRFTFTSAAAARKLILATDSLFRRRGHRLNPDRELVKEQRDVAPGVTGVWGML